MRQKERERDKEHLEKTKFKGDFAKFYLLTKNWE